MLFRKTFRNALATLIGAALALATGTAHAVVKLNATGSASDPVGTVTFSAETLSSSASKLGADNNTYFRIYAQNVPAALRVTSPIGLRATAQRDTFFRIELGNMVFWGNFLTTAVTIPDADGSGTGTAPAGAAQLEGGGGDGTNWVSVSWREDIAPDAVVTMAMHNNMAILPGATGTITVTAHDNVTDANRGRDPSARYSKPAVIVAQSVRSTATPTPGGVTATVATGFTGLGSPGANTLGTLTTTVGSSLTPHRSAVDGTEIDALAEAVRAGASGGSMATYTGDFSVGAFYAGTASPAACGNAPLRTRNAQMVALESVTVPLQMGTTSFCVAAPRGNTEPFMEGEYQVAVDYVPLANSVSPPPDLTAATIGRIRRDGTQVQIPYLTVNDAFRQRVVIVNRNMNPVGYSFSFTSEDEATTMPGEMATGMVPGNSTMVLPTTDIVSIEGRGRTSATLDVVATAGSVDVASTQVNLDTYSTDTVVYDTKAN